MGALRKKDVISGLPPSLPKSIDSLLFLGADSSESRVNLLVYCILFKEKKGLPAPGTIKLCETLSSPVKGLSFLV